METNYFTAPIYSNFEGPLVFLAGPIQGTNDWQHVAAKYILDYSAGIHVASPRRNLDLKKREFTAEMYNEQVDWETAHLKKAGENGVVLFWLATECNHVCERAYGQTSRFELAEWKMKHQYEGCKIVVGIEEGFTGAKYIRRRFGQDCPGVHICSNLQDTCRVAVSLIPNI